MLEALHLSKRYVQGRWYLRNRFSVTALDDVSLSIRPGSTLALVGESGAGKSTLGRCLSRLEEPDSGEVWIEGKNLLTLRPKELLAVRRNIQFIFQDSTTAMNPCFSAAQVVEEPLLIQTRMPRKTRRQQALAMMEQVGIAPQWGQRLVGEFSGGQRQRLAIARALILKPRLLILDEALSSIDAATQEQITKLLLDLQASLSLTYLFITHDLRLAAGVADQVAVMQSGRIVESGSISTLFFAAQHPYTRLLLAAIPGIQADGSTAIQHGE
jgi:peptide/nickel transport system ATP-binding protein